MTLFPWLRQAASAALYGVVTLVFALVLFVLAGVLLVIGPLIFAAMLIFFVLAALGSFLFPAAKH